MTHDQTEEIGSEIQEPGSTSTRGFGPTTFNSGWIGGAPPLPEGLLWAAIGDLDVIERLSRQGHQVRFPTWLCSSCGQPWPCRTARDDLLLDLGWIKLAIYCAVLMGRATKDLISPTPEELWQRFLGWTEPPEEIRNSFLQRTA